MFPNTANTHQCIASFAIRRCGQHTPPGRSAYPSIPPPHTVAVFGGCARTPVCPVLPPPLDVVVGLRQVHYLSEYWKQERGMKPGGDAVAEKYFPFISAPRFTLKEFARTPSMWFWFTKDWDDFDVPLLKD